ncbi:MAG: hypothetical protein CMG71_07670 [Candidatus Marinimicrobia bacterium]|nr:hypothetical protein [Candidatus Neomarinimicrobiota bacterium]|tara:strand:+ start:542 stop:1822 length:1281 start_codon:yes stop_codon:yes gene_type:complete
MKSRYILFTALLSSVSFFPLTGQSNFTARSVSLGGAFSSYARGVDALGWNPANLGFWAKDEALGEKGKRSVKLPFSLAFDLGNNTISPDWISDYFDVGYITDELKNQMINSLPDNDWLLFQALRVPFGFSINNFAVSTGLDINGRIASRTDVFELLFNGLRFDNSISLDGNVLFEAVIPVALGYGKEFYSSLLNKYFDRVYFGGAVKYLNGLNRISTEFSNSKLSTSKESFDIKTTTTLTSAISGTGLALDLGFSARSGEKLYLSISLNNLFGKINWSDSDIVNGSVNLNVDKLNFSELDSLFEESNSIDENTGKVSSTYPGYFVAGFHYQYRPSVSFHSTLIQGLSNDMNISTIPRFSLGSEMNANTWLPIRFGISVGGIEDFRWGTGFGLNFSKFHLDFGISESGGILNSAKGICIALQQTFFF